MEDQDVEDWRKKREGYIRKWIEQPVNEKIRRIVSTISSCIRIYTTQKIRLGMYLWICDRYVENFDAGEHYSFSLSSASIGTDSASFDGKMKTTHQTTYPCRV